MTGAAHDNFNLNLVAVGRVGPSHQLQIQVWLWRQRHLRQRLRLTGVSLDGDGAEDRLPLHDQLQIQPHGAAAIHQPVGAVLDSPFHLLAPARQRERRLFEEGEVRRRQLRWRSQPVLRQDTRQRAEFDSGLLAGWAAAQMLAHRRGEREGGVALQPGQQRRLSIRATEAIRRLKRETAQTGQTLPAGLTLGQMDAQFR